MRRKRKDKLKSTRLVPRMYQKRRNNLTLAINLSYLFFPLRKKYIFGMRTGPWPVTATRDWRFSLTGLLNPVNAYGFFVEFLFIHYILTQPYVINVWHMFLALSHAPTALHHSPLSLTKLAQSCIRVTYSCSIVHKTWRLGGGLWRGAKNIPWGIAVQPSLHCLQLDISCWCECRTTPFKSFEVVLFQPYIPVSNNEVVWHV